MVFIGIPPTDFYKILHPRPVYLIISSCNGKINISSIAWVSPVNDDPPTICMAVDSESYTSELINECGEFTVNVINEEKISIVWAAGTLSGKKVDKIKKLSIKLSKSEKLKTPFMEDSLGYLECKVIKKVEVNGVNLFIAKVLNAKVQENLYNVKYGWNISKARVLMHIGGRGFTTPSRLIIYREKGGTNDD